MTTIDPRVVMGSVQAIAATFKKAGKIEEYGQILELQSQVSEMIDLDREKSDRIRDLEEQLRIKSIVEHRRSAVWTGPSDEEVDGPFCATCHGKDNKLVHMTVSPMDRSMYSCGACKNNVRVFSERYVAPQPVRVIRG